MATEGYPAGGGALDERGAGLRQRPVKAKTSSAAVFALVFGLSALICALTLFLVPFAILFGIIAVILGIVGLMKAGEPHVTGRGVAAGGLILALLGLALSGALIVSSIAYLNDPGNLQRLQNQIADLQREIQRSVPN